MFNIGGGEILVIALIALVVLGPQRLPDAARKAGKMMNDLKQLSAGFQREVQQAFEEHGGASAVQAADKLKTITGGPLGPVRTGINAAVASVSSQARVRAPAEEPGKRSPAKKTTAKKATAKKAAPTKRGPAKKAAPAKKTTPARKVPAGASAKKAPAKRAAPAKKAAAKPVARAKRD
jgi:Tat protein translocase TatB subunit